MSDVTGDVVLCDVLTSPAWHALGAEQRSFGEEYGLARRFHSDVSPFAGLPDGVAVQSWNDLAHLVGPGSYVVVTGERIVPAAGWAEEFRSVGVQMTGEDVRGEPCPEAVVLTPDDVPEMLDLVRRTQPGPFEVRTIALGTYLGIRREGRLVAMAGERMRPPGYTEVSAVCTDPEFRGHGMAARLVRAVVHGITQRGAIPMLHVRETNTAAIRLYEHLDFAPRRRSFFVGVRSPEAG
jgi:ribosomal protein S18 acetylase RimI-like enzyme